MEIVVGVGGTPGPISFLWYASMLATFSGAVQSETAAKIGFQLPTPGLQDKSTLPSTGIESEKESRKLIAFGRYHKREAKFGIQTTTLKHIHNILWKGSDTDQLENQIASFIHMTHWNS